MGLKCSLFGHSFDETDVERDREERGSEVVTIVQEVERCSRCGKTRVVSENKEVTSIVEPDEVGLDDGDDATSSTALGNMAEGAESSTGSGFESGSDLDEFEAPGDPEEEDAEILEDNRPSDRRPGQWPDDDDDWSPDRLTRPDDPDDASEAATDADTDTDADADEPASTEGFVNDAAERAAAEAEQTASGGDSSDDGGEFIDAEADPANADLDADAGTTDKPTAAASGNVVSDGEYVCPECGFTARAENSPLRAGDACPECHRGYLDAGE